MRLFRGMVNDVRRRAPYYWSDWKDAWDYRVVPATVYMYFAKYDPLATGSIDYAYFIYSILFLQHRVPLAILFCN